MDKWKTGRSKLEYTFMLHTPLFEKKVYMVRCGPWRT